MQLSEAACHQNKLMPEQNNTSDAKTANSLYETQEMAGQEQFESQLSAARWKLVFLLLSVNFEMGIGCTAAGPIDDDYL